jgi:glutamine amidotransferase-like uncharacterized protein
MSCPTASVLTFFSFQEQGLSERGFRVSTATELPESLAGFDLIIFPGGSSSKQLAGIGAGGKKRVAQWVREGGGYVGFCAGAFLMEDTLGLQHMQNVHRKGDRDLEGTVTLQLASGAAVAANYHNGPVYDWRLPAGVVSVATLTDPFTGNLPACKMRKKSAVVLGTLGRGRVLLCGPHPEHTAGLEDVTAALVRMALPP